MGTTRTVEEAIVRLKRLVACERVATRHEDDGDGYVDEITDYDPNGDLLFVEDVQAVIDWLEGKAND